MKKYLRMISVSLLVMLMTISTGLIHQVKAEEEIQYTIIEGGIIDENLVLTKEKSPYKIADNIQLSGKGSLKVHEGVIIDGNNKKIEVYDTTVQIKGTKDEMVIIENLTISPRQVPDSKVEIEYAEFLGGTPADDRTNFTLKNSILRKTQAINLSWAWGDSTIERNVFIDAEPIILAPYEGYSEAHIKNNLFQGGAKNILFHNFPKGKSFIQHNSFFPSEHAIYVTNGDNHEINANDNYWGTTDKTEIDKLIFDRKNDLNSGVYVIYDRILDIPHLDTPKKEEPKEPEIPEIGTRLLVGQSSEIQLNKRFSGTWIADDETIISIDNFGYSSGVSNPGGAYSGNIVYFTGLTPGITTLKLVGTSGIVYFKETIIVEPAKEPNVPVTPQEPNVPVIPQKPDIPLNTEVLPNTGLSSNIKIYSSLLTMSGALLIVLNKKRK